MAASAGDTALETIWHIQDSQGQILALVVRKQALKCFRLFPLRSEAEGRVSGGAGTRMEGSEGDSLGAVAPLLVVVQLHQPALARRHRRPPGQASGVRLCVSVFGF